MTRPRGKRIERLLLITGLMTISSFIAMSMALGSQGSLVNYPYIGIQFAVPDGWHGAEDEDVYIMGSSTEPGLLMIMLNPATSPQELKAAADAGIMDQWTELRRSSDFVRVGAEGLGAEFSGYVEGQPAKAYLVGLINPFGHSVTVGALASSQQFSDRHRNLAIELANSVAFAVPKESEKSKEWRNWFKGLRLTHMFSSYSSGASYYDDVGQTYGSYSSYSRTVKVDLCSDGTFSYYSSDQSSFDNVGGFGNIQSSGDFTGQWKVSTTGGGESLLTLHFLNGDIDEYELRYQDGKTFLNDRRYFGTDSTYCH